MLVVHYQLSSHPVTLRVEEGIRITMHVGHGILRVYANHQTFAEVGHVQIAIATVGFTNARQDDMVQTVTQD